MDGPVRMTLDLIVETASVRLRMAAYAFMDACRKAGFDPSQPRVPAGTPMVVSGRTAAATTRHYPIASELPRIAIQVSIRSISNKRIDCAAGTATGGMWADQT